MKFSLKVTLSFLLFVSISQLGFSQKIIKPLYNTVVKTNNGQKQIGKLIAINNNSIAISNRNNVVSEISYVDVKKIKVYKRHKDIGYTTISGVLALGSIAAAQSIDDANTALLVGVGGTLGVVGLSMILHNLVHAPEAKLLARKEKINYNSVSQKLTKFVLK